MCTGALALFVVLEAAGLEPAAASPRTPASQAIPQSTGSLTIEAQLVHDIIARSYPNLRDADIRLKTFRSDSDYFRASFNLARFFVGRKMRYVILVNPEWATLGAPIEGVRSILAHELAHVEELMRGKRIRLFRLAGLVSRTRTARFERHADLEAVARDYGSGLKAYRAWLYNHVPARKLAEKRRDYLSPEEIDAVLAATARHPDLLDYWLRHVPMTLTEIQSAR